jgi:cell division protein FtsA
MGVEESKGVRKGKIADFRAASQCTHSAIIKAETSAGVKVDSVFLSQTGAHLESTFNKGSALVRSSDNRVSRDDIKRAVTDAKSKQLEPSRVYIHYVQNPFYLDGRRVEDPLAFEGERLEVGYLSIHGDERTIRDHIHVINGIGLRVEDMIVSSVASGASVASDAEKQTGVLVVDIGSGTADYVLYRDGYIVKTGAVPVGGDHITNDLRFGLRVDHENAEMIKKRYGKAVIDPNDCDEKIWLRADPEGGLTIGDRQIRKKGIYQIIHYRLDELFEIIQDELGGFLDPKHIGAGVVLTGGTSRMVGIEQVASSRLGIKARKTGNSGVGSQDISSPENSTVIGLLTYALQNSREDRRTSQRKGLLGKISTILNF